MPWPYHAIPGNVGYDSWHCQPFGMSAAIAVSHLIPRSECSDIHLRSPSEFDSDDSRPNCFPTSVQFGVSSEWPKLEQKGSFHLFFIQGTKHHLEAPNPGSDIRIDSLFFQRSLSRSPKTGRSWSSAHSLGPGGPGEGEVSRKRPQHGDDE